MVVTSYRWQTKDKQKHPKAVQKEIRGKLHKWNHMERKADDVGMTSFYMIKLN